MALEGNVRDFGLSEILQLIALQRKSGMLAITGERTMVIYFREGQVVSTRDRRQMANDPLKDYILAYGFLTAEEMKRLEHIQDETNLDLTDILISEKKFSEDELRTIFADQIQETMQEVLGWPKSQYKFIIGRQVLQGVRSFGSFKVEGLLMESMRRIDELPELLRIFPSADTVIKRLPMPVESRVPLDELEESVYDLLDQQMRIGELIPKTRMASFCTYEILKNLLEKELLQIVETAKPVAVETAEPAHEDQAPPSKRYLPAAAITGMLLLCFAFGEIAVPAILPPGWGLVRHARHRPTAAGAEASLAPNLAELDLRILEAAVREALEEQVALKGTYPARLETLVASGILSRTRYAAAEREGLAYQVAHDGKSYALTRKRP